MLANEWLASNRNRISLSRSLVAGRASIISFMPMVLDRIRCNFIMWYFHNTFNKCTHRVHFAGWRNSLRASLVDYDTSSAIPHVRSIATATKSKNFQPTSYAWAYRCSDWYDSDYVCTPNSFLLDDFCRPLHRPHLPYSVNLPLSCSFALTLLKRAREKQPIQLDVYLLVVRSVIFPLSHILIQIWWIKQQNGRINVRLLRALCGWNVAKMNWSNMYYLFSMEEQKWK